MNSPRVALRVAGIIFTLMALVHVWRLVTRFQIVIGQREIPLSVSAVGLIVAGALGIWMLMLSAKPR